MSGNQCRTTKSSVHKKEAKANFAWRSVSSDEASNRSKWLHGSDIEGLDDSDRGQEDWRVLLDDSDDSTSGWGQNSSSSSASWSDDLESEATSRLQQQLNVLDKIVFEEALTSEEKSVHIPSDLMEEATLWRTSYPHLCIKGMSLPVPPIHEDSFQEEATEEVIASHGIMDDDKQCNKPNKGATIKPNPKEGELVGNVQSQTAEELKADVMQRLFNHLWPDVLAYVNSKISHCPREVPNTGKDAEQLPLRLSHERIKNATMYQNPQPVIEEPKNSSNISELPEKFLYRYSNQLSPTHMALDSILKVSRLPLKQSAVSNIPSNMTHRSYQVLSSRGQTHLVSNRKNHVTLPPIETPSDSVRGNSYEGSLSHLRSASALSHEHHQLTTSRPNTSTLIPTNDKILNSSYFSVSPSSLSKNVSFNVLGKHLPASSTLPWYRSTQRRTSSIHR